MDVEESSKNSWENFKRVYFPGFLSKRLFALLPSKPKLTLYLWDCYPWKDGRRATKKI